MENDIKGFQNWCLKLGCPPHKLPKEDDIKMIFKSRQRDFICNVMKRVLPQQEVQKLREYILIKRMQKIKKQQVIPELTNVSLFPKELQLHYKLKELRQKREECEGRVTKFQRECEIVAASNNGKSIRCVELQDKTKTLHTRVNILKLKLKSFSTELEKERQHLDKIKSSMPVKQNAENCTASLANAAVEGAVKELQTFYDICAKNVDPKAVQHARESLWPRLRAIFDHLPNSTLFHTIMGMKEQELSNIMTMNKLTVDDKEEPGNIMAFQMSLLRSKAALMRMADHYFETVRAAKPIVKQLGVASSELFEQLETRLKRYADGCEGTELKDRIANFVLEYTVHNLNVHQNQFLAEQVELIKADIQKNEQVHEDHEVMLGTMRDVYDDINASINRVQYEMTQLSQINEKITYAKNMLKHIFNDMQASNNRSIYKSNLTMSMSMGMSLNCSKLNASTTSINSIDFNASNILCSTALDFDNSMASPAMNASLISVRGGGGSTGNELLVPTYAQELSVFGRISLQKFSSLNKECHFHLSPNPLIIESGEMLSTIQLAPGILLTAFGALQEIRNRIQWADLVAHHSTTMKVNLDCVTVDVNSLRQQIKARRERFQKILQRINILANSTRDALEKYNHLYKFMVENHARYCIPLKKMVNNRTYTDYEAEYMLYYRMVTTEGSDAGV